MTMNKLEKLGQNIKTLRQQKNLTQDDLANKMHVSRQSVSKWETGESAPDIENLISLAEIFDVSLDYLVLSKKSNQNLNEQVSSKVGVLEYLDRKNEREEERKIASFKRPINNFWEFLAEYWWIVASLIGTIAWAIAIIK